MRMSIQSSSRCFCAGSWLVRRSASSERSRPAFTFRAGVAAEWSIVPKRTDVCAFDELREMKLQSVICPTNRNAISATVATLLGDARFQIFWIMIGPPRANLRPSTAVAGRPRNRYTPRMDSIRDATADDLLGSPLPWKTADLPGIGGLSKERAEDFRVEEIPAYPPAGSGEFLFLWVEKTGLSAEQLVSHLARCLKIAHQDVGTAGMKDRQAVTCQMVSVPARCELLLKTFAHENIKVLRVDRHPHKLRTGHLRGNRFSILIRNGAPDALARAQAIAAALCEQGVPNFFGDQRFGRDAETLRLGLALLRGTKQPGEIPRARRKFLLRLALSSVQSALFNRALVERMRDGVLDRVLPGDVMQVVASGGPFVVVDTQREQERFAARETVISGPIFGPKMKQPAGEVAQRESRLLESAGIAREAFERFSNLTPGTRRAYLVWPVDLAVRGDPDGTRLEFVLPSGSYATIVLREFQKDGA